MNRPVFLLLALLVYGAPTAFAQTFLTADGQTDTYTLISNILGGDPVQPPDCNHLDFGPHITQALDSTLGKDVFVFHIHVTPDNDRCIMFDRQRNEIRTGDPSPDYLKAFLGDTTTYRWKFELDAGFQPSSSFTHIHQLKASNGDADQPIITITPIAGSPEKLQLKHTGSEGETTVVADVELSQFKSVWVEAYEKVTWAFNGAYSLEIRRVSDGAMLFSYANDNIDMWRTGTTVSRPKWGIYRGLHDQSALRDEQVRFDRFCLAKGGDDCPSDLTFLTLPSPVLPSAEVGVGYSAPLVTGGLAPYTFNLIKGVFPPGLSGNSADGHLTGTPDPSKGGSFTVEIIDQLNSSVTGKFKIKILGALGITTTALKAGTQGKAYKGTLKAKRGMKPYTWSLVSGSLPSSLTLNALTGAITGIPTQTGPFDLTFQVTDPLGGQAQKNLTLTVN